MMGVPSTIPPFQATNAPKAASTVEYGRNDGKIWGNTLGNAAIDHSRSAAHQHGARSQLHEKGRDTRKRAPTGRCSKGGRIVKLITRVCGPTAYITFVASSILVLKAVNEAVTEPYMVCTSIRCTASESSV